MSSAAPTTENTKTGRTTFADVALVSELGDLGWKVEGEGRSWKAFEQEGEKRELGPATSVKALHTMVQLAVGNLGDRPKEPDSKTNGSSTGKTVKASQPILNGTKDAVLEDLRTAIIEYRETTMSILDLQKSQKAQGETVKNLMHKFEDELSTDVDGHRYFQSGMVKAYLVIEEKEVLKTEAVKN